MVRRCFLPHPAAKLLPNPGLENVKANKIDVSKKLMQSTC